MYASLANLWKAWGIEPEMVAGEGVGQLAAACVADVLKYEDAFALLILLHQSRDSMDWDEFEKQIDQLVDPIIRMMRSTLELKKTVKKGTAAIDPSIYQLLNDSSVLHWLFAFLQ